MKLKNEDYREAMYLTLLVWSYFAKHPEINSKVYLPKKIFDRIKFFRASCPLCSIFREKDCEGCPLFYCGNSSSDFNKWVFAETFNSREFHAKNIVKKVLEWNREKGERKRYGMGFRDYMFEKELETNKEKGN